ncbi:MAG: heavy metal-associated domain-containing protein, partial [Terracoccus sp.]
MSASGTTSHTTPDTARSTSEVRLSITGMTCASCSARIERRLTKMPGIDSASVNLATEKALVAFTAPVTAQQIVTEVEKTGYGATVIRGTGPRGPQATRPGAGALLEKLGSEPSPGTAQTLQTDAVRSVGATLTERVVKPVAGSFS